jgi:hypothetical protein
MLRPKPSSTPFTKLPGSTPIYVIRRRRNKSLCAIDDENTGLRMVLAFSAPELVRDFIDGLPGKGTAFYGEITEMGALSHKGMAFYVINPPEVEPEEEDFEGVFAAGGYPGEEQEQPRPSFFSRLIKIITKGFTPE